MRVQIVGGAWRGRVLTIPKGPAIRPTAQKVRQALFDLLGPRVQGASVLDLFAGSGALGLEAMSRGAQQVVFVEREPACTEAIRKTLSIFGIPPGVDAELLTDDAFGAVRRLGRAGRRFALILMDPPYQGPGGKKALQGVAAHAILAPSGLVVVERARRQSLPEVVEDPTGERRLQQGRVARYGDTELVFYQWMTEVSR